jgi:hypothetical protein
MAEARDDTISIPIAGKIYHAELEFVPCEHKVVTRVSTSQPAMFEFKNVYRCPNCGSRIKWVKVRAFSQEVRMRATAQGV